MIPTTVSQEANVEYVCMKFESEIYTNFETC